MSTSTVRIDADVLVPGRGEPVADATVVLDGRTVGYAGPRAGAPETPGVTAITVPAVMPGMWDCHCHFLGARHLDLAALVTEPLVLNAARAVTDAGKALHAGFTSVREAGGIGVHLARAVAEGSIAGPSIYGPGAIISPTGGHADLHRFPLDWVHSFTERTGMLAVADGVPEVLRVVRQQLRLGAAVIKVCASGGVFSDVDHPIHQQFSDEELRAAVEEAGRADRVVMAHCHGKPGILAALHAGVRTIEHGSFLDEECAAAMRETGAILVPTRHIVEGLLVDGAKGGLPEHMMRKAVEIADQHLTAMQLAIESGVTVAMGTDIAFSDPRLPAHWGDNAQELVNLVKAGMTPLQAIEAATATAPLTLGPQAPRSGLLAEGYDADVIAVTADPSLDVSVLTDPDNITHVWKGGVRAK